MVRSRRYSGKKRMMALSVLVLAAIGAVAVFAFNPFAAKNSQAPASSSQEPQAANTKPAAAAGSSAGTSNPAPATPKPEPEPPTETVDVAVIGSELEGLYLARAAADEGLRVKVLDPREAFGGQVLQGEMLFLDEVRDEKGNSLSQGRVKELFDGFRNGKIRKQPEFAAYFDKLKKDIPVESGIRLDNVKQIPGSFGPHAVESVDYQTKDGVKKRLAASYWLDNTDFAALLGKLQTTRLPGLEAFYGQQNIEYMSSGYMMKFKNVDWEKFRSTFNNMKPEERSAKYEWGVVDNSFAVGLSGVTKKYKPSNDRIFLRGLNAVNQRNGEVLINALLVYTVDPSDDKSVADALELGKKEMPAVLQHFRNNLPGWEHAELNGFPNYLYIREYNHYETDYVLKVSDMLGARMFWDDVSIAGYPLDLQGTSANKWGIEMGRPDKYGMPLRSFMLKNYDNVLVAGKNVGASAIAYGSARIQPNTSLAAETIGIMLGQLHGKKKLREIKEADMPALHSYLESKYKIKLTGATGHSKLTGWTADELAKLDSGEITYPSYSKTRKK
ncbi:FAD-dependent oxidoreductase [Paenibacillus thalictri]|uniref:FAD-dependent oxidoreductase n=1 Tax=Paenibacillus thalictri TaxID=2527873 RepID=A0A4Q9DXG4_9BACL|nr:FAD-dependent oxidoreductase [Paenibacillus thalictri]TBL81817.1 FAD-dependent oxidoreductase [Paenibacillus thalictri]